MTVPKLGICAWSFWGDSVVDRPDNTDEVVVSHIVDYYQRVLGGGRVAYLQHVDVWSPEFTAEMSQLREAAWDSFNAYPNGEPMPDLDVIFCRWRWNVGQTNDPRLLRQQEMLDHYGNTNTRILVWDEDFQMTQDERSALTALDNVTLIETSESARAGHEKGLVYVPHPIALPPLQTVLDRVLPEPFSRAGDHLDANMRVAYVGNNYERAEFIDALLGAETSRHPGGTHFYGNWGKYDDSSYKRWPNITFHPKVGREMRDWAYQHAGCVPMLAKDVYFKRGHITPRLHEVIHAGAIPVGFDIFNGAERYYPSDMIASGPEGFADICDRVNSRGYDRKLALKREYELLADEKIFDVELFFKQIDLA